MVSQQDLDELKSGPTNPQDEIQYALKQAVNEIVGLRQDNHVMRVRLQMFDDCMVLMNARGPSVNMGYSEDVVRLLNKHIDSKP